MKDVRNRTTGRTFTAPSRYWVQARTGETFAVCSKHDSKPVAVEAARVAFAAGGYAEVIVQNIDNGRRVAAFA